MVAQQLFGKETRWGFGEADNNFVYCWSVTTKPCLVTEVSDLDASFLVHTGLENKLAGVIVLYGASVKVVKRIYSFYCADKCRKLEITTHSNESFEHIHK